MRKNRAKKNIGFGVGFTLCLVILTTACGQQRGNAEPEGEITVTENPSDLGGDFDEERHVLPEQELADVGAETDNGTENVEEADEDSEEAGASAEGEGCFPYDYYDVDAPWIKVQVEAGEEIILSRLPIRGLIGYSPESSRIGGISYYKKDREVIIEENVGKGLFQSERLAVVREEIKNMFIDIIRSRGEDVDEYLEYFASATLLEEACCYLKTELPEDWILLQVPYLDEYAGNADEYILDVYVGEDGDYVWVVQPTETESHYYFSFEFDADYRAMGYGELDCAKSFCFRCSVSKDMGLIDEFNITYGYLTMEDLESLRWDDIDPGGL